MGDNMKKRILRISLVVLIFVLLTYTISKATTVDDIISSAKGFISSGSGASTPIGEDDIKDLSNIIYNILASVGAAIAIIVAAILGIKLMTGSVEEQAKTKEMLVPFGIGCAVVFGAFVIWKVVVNILQSSGL